MTEITVELIKQLRDTTGAGMMDAKQALTAADVVNGYDVEELAVLGGLRDEAGDLRLAAGELDDEVLERARQDAPRRLRDERGERGELGGRGLELQEEEFALEVLPARQVLDLDDVDELLERRRRRRSCTTTGRPGR